MNDTLLNKKESIERCIKQIKQYYYLPSELPFTEDYFKQDAIAANIQRLCESCIDLANIVIRKGKLGLPKESRESFSILYKEKIISETMAKHLIAMVGFRNVLVHQYQNINLDIMVEVIEKHLEELIDFTNIVIEYVDNCSA
jgi:uncharacterized protein YutE (UPF0331/DUF86 family)